LAFDKSDATVETAGYAAARLFADLPLSFKTQSALKKANFVNMTDVQHAATPNISTLCSHSFDVVNRYNAPPSRTRLLAGMSWAAPRRVIKSTVFKHQTANINYAPIICLFHH